MIRFAIVKYTSKSDKKISVTEWLTDWMTDICIPRAAFAAENVKWYFRKNFNHCHCIWIIIHFVWQNIANNSRLWSAGNLPPPPLPFPPQPLPNFIYSENSSFCLVPTGTLAVDNNLPPFEMIGLNILSCPLNQLIIIVLFIYFWSLSSLLLCTYYLFIVLELQLYYLYYSL